MTSQKCAKCGELKKNHVDGKYCDSFCTMEFIPSEDVFEKDIDFLKRNKVQDRIMKEKGCGKCGSSNTHEGVSGCVLCFDCGEHSPSCSSNHTQEKTQSTSVESHPVVDKREKPSMVPVNSPPEHSGSDFKLSEKYIYNFRFSKLKHEKLFWESDIKEFILRLKEEFTFDEYWQEEIIASIDKLSGFGGEE